MCSGAAACLSLGFDPLGLSGGDRPPGGRLRPTPAPLTRWFERTTIVPRMGGSVAGEARTPKAVAQTADTGVWHRQARHAIARRVASATGVVVAAMLISACGSSMGHGAGCTPGYSPCIPPGPDVDCAGGSGNGPRYIQGPVQVTGSDPYHLDSDGDGVGPSDAG